MLRILVVIGTRPEAIKLAPTILEFQEHQDLVQVEVCITGQHRSLLDNVLNNFGIPSKYDLNLMSANQTLEAVTSKALTGVSEILAQQHFDWIIVQGDTSTALAASLAGFYSKIKVAHVEAGLRTHNKSEPFPEEINRQLISKIADLHFAPTQLAKDNLVTESVPPSSIVITGNTVIDALGIAFNSEPSARVEELLQHNTNKKLIVVTAHRRENFGDPLIEICEALKYLANYYSDSCHFVYPVHPNPNVQTTVYDYLEGIPNVSLVEPLDYFDFIQLLKQSFLIVTDSGGIQEEAPSLKIPVFVLRNHTERTEGIQKGIGLILGTNKNDIIEHITAVINSDKEYKQYIKTSNPYGDGKASERIVNKILNLSYSEFVEA